MEKEIWKPIKGYEDSYMISNHGRVESLTRKVKCFDKFNDRVIKGKILKYKKDNCGYMRITLSKNGIKKKISLHRLCASHFLDNPKKMKYVNHIDRDKTNNFYKNLEWCSHRENTTHAVDKTTTSSNCVGVYLKKGNRIKRWCASISVLGVRKHLGYFETELEAYETYLKALEYYNLHNKYA